MKPTQRQIGTLRGQHSKACARFIRFWYAAGLGHIVTPGQMQAALARVAAGDVPVNVVFAGRELQRTVEAVRVAEYRADPVRDRARYVAPGFLKGRPLKKGAA